MRSDDEGSRSDGLSKSRNPSSRVQKFPERHSSSRDRQGRIFDPPIDHSVRAVTPEPIYENPGTVFNGDANIPHSPKSYNHNTALPIRRREVPVTFVPTEEDNTIESRRRKAQIKPNTRDDLGTETSPGSFISKTRKRLGSITTGMTGGGVLGDEAVNSIGFPSVVHSSGGVVDSHDQYQTPRTPRRAFSPDLSARGYSRAPRAAAVIEVDPNKVLQAMRLTGGRMHGILFFRRLHTTAWDSGYCAINMGTGSLICQVKGDVNQKRVLLPELRGCSVRTHFDQENQSTHLTVLMASSGLGFQLRPPVPETFESWLGALLCWQPLKAKGGRHRSLETRTPTRLNPRPVLGRRISESSTTKVSATLKIGKVMLWNGPLPSGSQLLLSRYPGGEDIALWKSVSCALHENGIFKLFGDSNAQPLSIPLAELGRCAIQRLDESVLEQPRCIAIYPHYTPEGTMTRQLRPIVLSFESEVAMEAWFVLLRAFTVPELYSSAASSRQPDVQLPQSQRMEDSGTDRNIFRIERALSIKITEAKLSSPQLEYDLSELQKTRGRFLMPGQEYPDFFTEIATGKDLRARTAVKPFAQSIFWADEFQLKDLPSMLDTITVSMKFATPGEKEWSVIAIGGPESLEDVGQLPSLSSLEISSHDPVFGQVILRLDDLAEQKTLERWWPLTDHHDVVVGQLLMRITLQENYVLMTEEYKKLTNTLHNFSNNVTTQIARMVGTDLRQLADILVDIFQTSGSVNEWIKNLIEDDIDGAYKQSPPMRLRYGNRMHSHDQFDTNESREMLVRDLSRSATTEANLLFRGNSLATKAFDTHMRRLGRDYLSETIGDKLRKIVEADCDCEVDPNRVSSAEQLEHNWENLIYLTSVLWRSMAASASRCPPGLRLIFKHVRSCAEDRYGSFIKTVKYTSVSGFLFLRFFCPAIMNPKLFGLLNEHPRDRAKRTFTLIAKSLQGLANMTRFGAKEPWMEPMNKFLASSTPEFKSFIEEICTINSTQMEAVLEPQYTAPNQIKNRLGATLREGLPALPYLLDSTKLHAELVELWMSNVSAGLPEDSMSETVRNFHRICRDLHARTRECVTYSKKPESWAQSRTTSASRSDKSSKLSSRITNPVGDQFIVTPNDAELTALPQRAEIGRNGEIVVSPGSSGGASATALSTTITTTSSTTPGSTNTDHQYYRDSQESTSTPPNLGSAGWERRIPYPRQSEHRAIPTNSTNSSTVSLETGEDGRMRPLPNSRDGSTKKSLFDLVAPSSRRKARSTGGAASGDDSHDF